MEVTDVLRDRLREPEGLQRMVALSLVAHVALVAGLLLMPASWQTRNTESLRTVMTINLGGAPGPRAGGMTPLGGRPIQAPAPTDSARAQPVRPPATKTPEMTMPRPGAKPLKTPPVKSAPAEARGRTPTTGAEPSPANAIAETGARGVGFGLSTGGGGTGGFLDVANFCCPEYVTTMVDLIRRNWNSKQEVAGETMVKFTIQRDGRLTDVQVEQSSGYAALDLTAQRALLLTRQLPSLPGAFTEDHLTVHLKFQYQR